MGNARAFFEGHLAGLFSWDKVLHHKAEPLPPLANGRKNPLGKFRERIVVGFGAFELTVESSEEAPPLGWLECRHMASGELREGVPDPVTWESIAKFIKGKTQNE
jgi:hypothetical protein